MAKTPIASQLVPVAGLPDGSIVSGSPQIIDYTSEILRNPIDTQDVTARSALSLLPEEEQFIVEQHIKRSPDLFGMSELVLTNRMRTAGYQVSSTENLLRNKFWLEYDHAVIGSFPRIRLIEVIRGVCSFKFFRETLLGNQYMVAYLMLPPMNFKAKQEETLLFSLDRLRAVLDLPIHKLNGDIDMNVVKAQMGVYQIIERRVQGEVIQKTQNIHALLPMSPATSPEVDAVSEEQIILKMQELVDKQRTRATNKAALSNVFVTEGRRVPHDT
jgi:hypothetical protein